MSERRRTSPTTPPPSDERQKYLKSVAEALWPATVAEAGATQRAAARNAYVVVPNARRPTLVLPLRPRRVTAAGLRHYKTSANTRTRLKMQLLALGAQVGLADLLPDRIDVSTSSHGTDSGIESYLSAVLERDVLVSLYVGPNRAIQKPVLQLLSPRGHTLGFAKIGTNPLTQELVRTEGETLARLSQQSWNWLTLPSVLHHGTWHGLEVLVQEPLSGSRQGKISPSLLTDAMLELASSNALEQTRVTESGYWRRLCDRVGQLPASSYAESLTQTVKEIADLVPDVSLDFGAWHGDWAPWNMAASSERLGVWDWEQYDDAVPLGYDALHFSIQVKVVSDNQSPDTAVKNTGQEAAALLAPFGVRPEVAALVMLLYVVDISARYLHDGEDEAGTRMGNLDSWLSVALERQLHAISEGR